MISRVVALALLLALGACGSVSPSRVAAAPEQVAVSGIGCPQVANAAVLPARGGVVPASATEPVTVFRDVSLIAMTGAPVQHGTTVIVRGQRIAEVGRELATPAGATVIDGAGMWLMPGLVDAHMHLTNIQSIDRPLLEVALANGITSEIELGGSGQPNPASRLWMRNEIAAGRLNGPTLYVAAPKINDSELSRSAAARLIDDYKEAGYDLIKVYNRLSMEGYRGVILRARQHGLPVVGHVVREVGLEGVLGAGQHGIVHAEEYLTYLGFRVSETVTDPTSLLDPAAFPYLAERTRAAGVFVTPTLVTFGAILEQVADLERVLARPGTQYMPGPLYSGDWPREVNPYVRNFSKPEHQRNLAAATRYLSQLTKALADAGVPLLAGSDAPIPGVAPGFGLHEELERLVAAGLTPGAVLTAATCTPAIYLGRTDFGVVSPGRRADLLLLAANPLADIRNSRSIIGVMARGKWFDSAQLQALLESNRRRP